MTKTTITPVFFRSGGRGAQELRTVRLIPDYVVVAEGSVLIEVGQTRVLCNATIEQGVPAWLRNSGRGWVYGGVWHVAARDPDPHSARV